MNTIEIVTGAINSGKTTYLLSRVQSIIKEKINIKGILSVKNSNDGYDALLIDGKGISESIPFIHRIGWGNGIFNNFSFDERIFDLVSSMVDNDFDIFILDEIGQLEIKHKKGFYNILNKLFNKQNKRLIFSVKELLIKDFLTQFDIIGRFEAKELNSFNINRL